jgi:sulfur-oxidizing protein SoxY
MMNIIKKISFLILVTFSLNLWAEANPELWPFVKEKMFQDRPIIEAGFVKLSGPKRASSGAQVPVKLELSAPDGVTIKHVFLIIDANPTQHAATYFLSEKMQEVDISTRIRMETDSFVRAVAEDDKGNLYMSFQEIRASGGCSGYMDVHDPELTADLGKILIKAKDDFLVTRIKHPNFTGLQRDLDSGGYIPEWIVKDMIYMNDNEVILAVHNKISISQDPYLKVRLPKGVIGDVVLNAIDTKGNKFSKDIKI